MTFRRRLSLFDTLFYKKVITNFIVIFSLTLSTGCGQQAKVASVDLLAKEFFETLKNNDLDKAMGMYSEGFFNGIPRELWRQKLESLTKELGAITSYSFRNKQADSRYSGKFYIYQYDTIHNGKRAKHTVTFIHPVTGGAVKIAGHRIKAPGFDG